MMYREAVKLIDVNGQEHFLTKLQVKLGICLFYFIGSLHVKGEDDDTDRLGGVLHGLGVLCPVLQDSPLQCGQGHKTKTFHLRVWKEEIHLGIQG